jgi:hypothetical protein
MRPWVPSLALPPPQGHRIGSLEKLLAQVLLALLEEILSGWWLAWGSLTLSVEEAMYADAAVSWAAA